MSTVGHTMLLGGTPEPEDNVSPQELAAGFRRLNRRSKYNSKTKTVEGRTFHSIREANRYQELRLMERAGAIRDLCCQVRFRLTAHGKPICVFVADFTYYEDGQLVVEDAKGFRTPTYRLKAKLFAAEYRREIREV